MLQLIKSGFLILACGSILQLNAQDSYKKIKSEATEFYRIEEYHHALPFYLKLDSLRPNDAEVNYHIGICYYNSEHKLRALPYLVKSKKLMHKHHELDLMLAKLYHLHNEFDKAEEHYNHHRKYINAKSDEGAKALKELDNYIAQCQTAKELMAKPLNYEIINLGPNVNSKYSDYAPVISADETMLIFTSKRNTTTGGGYDEINDCYYEDVLVSYHIDSTWTPAKGIGEPINTGGHDACIGLSPDGQKLFVYRSNQKEAEDIFVSDLNGDKWKTPVKLNNNINTNFWESHATITADEQTLYFTSSKPGGKGGKDIYISKRKADGDWGPAEDLSAKINTDYDEDCPYIHPDGKTLYFSSMGHKSMGGYDIFKTVYNEDTKEWTEPENIGYPINTTDDDLFLVWSADGTRAYFSSIRPDTYGEKDIYVAKKKEVSNFVVVLKGKVVDKVTKKPISAVLNVNNLTTGEMVGVFTSNSSTGKFIVVLPAGKDFSVTAEAAGYVFHSEHINIVEQNKFFEVEETIELQPIGTKDKVLALNNVFFDYSKSSLRPQSKIELNKLADLLKSNKDLFVEIAAHTDSIGSQIYNMQLSNERAKSVVNYLVANGVDSSRLSAIGYGEDFPLSSNRTLAGRQLNSRSEFYFVEKFDHLTPKQRIKTAFYYRLEAEKLEEKRKAAEVEAIRIADTHHDRNVIIKDSKYKLRIYFAGHTSHLVDTTNQDLLELIHLFKENKGLPLQIIGHTDSKRSDHPAADLVRKRMESIVQFFTSKGIPSTSIVKTFAGDQKPHVSNNTPEGHRLNRDVEVLLNIRNIE